MLKILLWIPQSYPIRIPNSNEGFYNNILSIYTGIDLKYKENHYIVREH